MLDRYNLIDEKWIPSVEREFISLKDVFSFSKLANIGGNPIEKIALFKFLLAICQIVLRPKTNRIIRNMSESEISIRVLEYFEQNYDKFDLYGDNPIFQVKGAVQAKIKTFSEVSIEISTGNTSVLYSSQLSRDFSEREKALMLLTMLSFAPGGKKTDNSVILSPGYGSKSNEKGNPSSSKAGPSLGFKGYLHAFLFGKTIIETLKLNLFSEEYINNCDMFPFGVGNAPWINPPKGEDCDQARILKGSYMGTLMPYCRFMLLTDGGVHYTEGIKHDSIYDGKQDLSMTVMKHGKKPKCLWVDPNVCLLSNFKHFFNTNENSETSFYCPQIINGLSLSNKNMDISLWAGGLKISSKAGEQYCSGDDDYFEDELSLDKRFFNEKFYDLFIKYVDIIKNYEGVLYYSVRNYYEELKLDHSHYIKKATQYFWFMLTDQIVLFFDLIESDEEKAIKSFLFKKVYQIYNEICPATSAVRILAFAKHSPGLKKDTSKNE